MEPLVRGEIQYRYLGEDESAHDRILWVTCGKHDHGADAIHGNRDVEIGTKGGGCQYGSTRAGRANARVYNRWWNVESMSEDALERECLEMR